MATNNAPHPYGKSYNQEDDQKLWHNDPEVTSMNSYIRGLIAEKLSKLLTAQGLTPTVYNGLVSSFERSLLEDAATKEEYMNKETLDHRLESLLQNAGLKRNTSSSNEAMPRHGIPMSNINAGNRHSISSRDSLGGQTIRSPLPSQMIPYPQHNILSNPYMDAPYTGFVPSTAEAPTSQQQSHYYPYGGQMGFMGRSGNMSMEQHMSYLRKNQVGHSTDAQFIPQMDSRIVPQASYAYMTPNSTFERGMQPKRKMQKVCQSQQKPLQSFVQDQIQGPHHNSERFYRVQSTAVESLSSAPIGAYRDRTCESECDYCSQYPRMFEYFKNRINPLFREKKPKLCMQLDHLTSHLRRSCDDINCNKEQYRLVYQHYVDCARFAYNEKIKKKFASQNYDSSLSKLNRGIQRTHNNGEVGQPTSMEFRTSEHLFPPHSSSLHESSQVATSIDQRHSEERLPQMLQPHLPMPLGDQTKVTESNMQSFVNPAQGHGNLNEMKNDQSEGSLQVVNETRVEGRIPEKMDIDASFIDPFTPNQIKERV